MKVQGSMRLNKKHKQTFEKIKWMPEKEKGLDLNLKPR